MTGDEFLAFNVDHEATDEAKKMASNWYEINEAWWLKLLCQLKILKRRYEWLTFTQRFYDYVLNSPSESFMKHLEIDRRINLNQLSVEEGRDLLVAFHLKKTPIGLCYYNIFNRHEFKYLFGKVSV